jgi:hypothetical protein
VKINLSWFCRFKVFVSTFCSQCSKKKLYFSFDIQNVPGGKVNILGGRSIGHSKQESMYVYVSYPERFPRQSYTFPKLLIRKILLTVSNTCIYCLSDKVGTVYLV